MAVRLRTKTSTTSNKNRLQNQVSNYKTRFSRAGLEDPTDTRNALEKKLNLEKDQNVLFDIFEIINRPQNALFTGIDEVLSGGSFAEGLKEGITGETKTTGKDLLLNHTNLDDEEGRLNAVDVLGFGLDVVADPLDYILAPVKVANTAADVAKAVDAARAAGKTADEIANIAKVAEKGTHWALNASEGWRPASEVLLRGAGGVIKGAGRKADELVEAGLKASDARNLAKVENYAQAAGVSTNKAARELNRSINKLGTYQDIKRGISRTLDSSKNLNGLTRKARDAEGVYELNKTAGTIANEALNKRAREIATTMAQKTNGNADEIYDTIARNLNTAVEANYDWTIRGDEILNELTQNKNIDLFTKKNADKLQKELRKYGINVNTDGRYVKLIDNKAKLANLTDEFANKTFGKRLSVEDLKDIKDADNFFKQSDELRSLYDDASKTLSDIATTSDKITGIAAKNITKEGYIPHVLTEDTKEFLSDTKKLGKGTNSQFNTRKYNMTTNEVNRLKARQLSESQEKVARGLEKRTDMFKKDADGNVLLDKDGNYVRDEDWFNAKVSDREAEITKLKQQEISAQELTKLKTEGIDAIDKSKLTNKDLKKLNVVEQIDDYQNTVRELKTLDFNKIPAENSEVVKSVRTAVTDYKKANTKVVNALKNGADDATVKTLKENADLLKKEVTVQINKAKKYMDKQSIDAVKDANKAFKEGKSVGAKIQKAEMNTQRAIALKNELAEEAGTLSNSLKETIAYKEAALKKFKNAEESVWNRQVESLNKLYESEKLLSSREGQQFFQTNFFDSITAYVNRNAQFSKGAQVYNEALQNGIFGNPEYIKFADDLKDGKIPYGFEKVNGTYLNNKLSKYNGILPEGVKTTTLDNLKGKTVYMDKELANILRVGSNALSNEVHPLLKVWDGMNNVFRKFSTFTLGFHMRNFTGNMSNMVLSGMPASKIPEYYKKAASLWNKSDDLMQKFVAGSLSEAEQIEWNTLQEFYEAGFAQAFTKGQGFEEIAEKGAQSKKLVDKITGASLDLNNKLDSYNRLALMMYAKDTPSYLEKIGKATPIEAVRYALFDPSNMSDIERNVMKRIIPFYTFTKQNLLFQADNLMKNTPRYTKLYKAIRDAYDDLPDDSYYGYQRDSMQIPIPFTGEDGNPLFLKTNLPLSDLGEYLENPLQRITSSVSPVIRVPFEMATGISTFTGDEAQYNSLTGLANTLGIPMSPGVQNTVEMTEQILNGLGLQNVSSNVAKKINAILQNYNGDKTGEQLWAEIFRSVLQSTQQENVQLNNLYDDLEAYQAEISRLKKQGIDIPTIKEITASNNLKLNNLKKKRASSK